MDLYDQIVQARSRKQPALDIKQFQLKMKQEYEQKISQLQSQNFESNYQTLQTKNSEQHDKYKAQVHLI